MVTIHDGNLEKTACESPDSQQSQLGKADIWCECSSGIQTPTANLDMRWMNFTANGHGQKTITRNTRKEELGISLLTKNLIVYTQNL